MKDKLEEEKKDKALKMAQELAREDMTEAEVVDASEKAREFVGRKALSKVKDKLEIALELLKDPGISKIVFTTLIGAILYLVLPVDVVPDVIPLLGLVDDAFVISVIFDRAVKQLRKDPEKVGEIIDKMPTRLKKPAISLLGAAGGAYAGWKGGEALALELENRKLNDVVDSAMMLVRDSISSKIQTEERNGFIRRMASSFFTLSLFLMALLVNIVEPENSRLWILSLVFLLSSYSVGIYSFIRGCREVFVVIGNARKEKGLRNGIRATLKKKVKAYGAAMTALEALKGSWNALPGEEDIEKMAMHSIRFFYLDILRFVLVTVMMVLGFALLKLFLRSYTGFSMNIWKLFLFPVFYR